MDGKWTLSCKRNQDPGEAHRELASSLTQLFAGYEHESERRHEYRIPYPIRAWRELYVLPVPSLQHTYLSSRALFAAHKDVDQSKRMHLDHRIPWNALAAHLSLIRSNKSLTPHSSDLFWNRDFGKDIVTQEASISKTQGYFIRAFISSICDFGATISTGNFTEASPPESLFSEDLMAWAETRYDLLPHETNSAKHNPLSSDYRDLDHWRRAANSNNDPQVEPSYSTIDANLGDAVKMLITLAATTPRSDKEKILAKEAMRALFRLDSDAHVPLHNLDNLSWGHGFGVSQLGWFTLQIYIIVNLYGAVSESGRNKGNMLLLDVQMLLDILSSDALQDYDFPAQNIPHRAFWHSLGLTASWAQNQRGHVADSGEGQVFGDDGEIVVNPLGSSGDEKVQQALKRLQEYLKTCFAMLYTYDVLLRRWYGDERADQKWTKDLGCIFAKIHHL